jgi:hypothetical protein
MYIDVESTHCFPLRIDLEDTCDLDKPVIYIDKQHVFQLFSMSWCIHRTGGYKVPDLPISSLVSAVDMQVSGGKHARSRGASS